MIQLAVHGLMIKKIFLLSIFRKSSTSEEYAAIRKTKEMIKKLKKKALEGKDGAKKVKKKLKSKSNPALPPPPPPPPAAPTVPPPPGPPTQMVHQGRDF